MAPPNSPQRVALYGRVSTRDKGHEVQNQLRQLQEFAIQSGWSRRVRRPPIRQGFLARIGHLDRNSSKSLRRRSPVRFSVPVQLPGLLSSPGFSCPHRSRVEARGRFRESVRNGNMGARALQRAQRRTERKYRIVYECVRSGFVGDRHCIRTIRTRFQPGESVKTIPRRARK